MRLGSTLSRYFSAAFARTVGAVFGMMFLLIYLLDYVELLRRAGDSREATASLLALLCLFRVPFVTEQVLPFAVLFGAMLAFVNLTRRLELVVARAAGLSVWQFLLSPVLVALVIGCVATFAYNPLSANFKLRADRMEAKLFGASTPGGGQTVWLRQKSIDGQAILRADRVEDDGVTLSNVTAFVFEPDGSFLERVAAKAALLQPGVWRFDNARVLSPDEEPRDDKVYLLATHLTPEQLTQAVVAPDDVSFWSLRAVERRTADAGLDTAAYRLRFQTLLARPLLLIAMVLIAATVSLRFFRSGGVTKMVSGGVAAGFMLYVATKLTGDLGGAGILTAAVAAWSPAIVGSMLATFVLLHQEDG